MEEITNDNSLTILLITDTHKYDKNMILLRDKLIKENKKYDLIFHTGDFDSISTYNWENFYQLTLEEQENADKVIFKALEYFAEFSKSNVVYFITGNHDSPNFNNPIVLNSNNITEENTKNYYSNAKYYKVNNKTFCLLNNSIVRINTTLLREGLSSNDYPKSVNEKDYDLEILGIGGSVPTQVRPCKFYNYSEGDLNRHIWDGIPYSNKQTFEEDYINDVDMILKHRESPKRKYILLTHSGGESLTSDCFEKNSGKFIDMGSTALTYRLYSEENLIFTCHGHSHDAQGRNEIFNEKLMINAGSLLEKYYSEVFLFKDKFSEWKVKSTFFNKLSVI
jgi:Icc-related predicted phosphoesterase